MIYSRQLITEEPQRQDIPARMQPRPTPAVEQPKKPTVKITKSRKTPFGSTSETITFHAICEETGEIVEAMEFTQSAWNGNTLIYGKKEDFADRLREKGYKVQN